MKLLLSSQSFNLDLGILLLSILIHLVCAMASPEVTTTMALPPSPVDTKRWWKSPNLRTLNFLMMIPLLSIFSQGSVHDPMITPSARLKLIWSIVSMEA